MKPSIIEFLQKENIAPAILRGIQEFRSQYPRPPEKEVSQAQPHYHYYGKNIWEQAATAILCGKNLLLCGAKATGKNVLAENLAAAFDRPRWNVSLHINMDASFMVGTDTFAEGRVSFRPGPVYQCAQKGGFCILDEINMARNEALAVLHSLLDYRRMMDIPGYDLLKLHPATRFIATMNYGYAGTRELNEALASRFVVLRLPVICGDDLITLLQSEYPTLRPAAAAQLAGMFTDLQKKCASGEISSRALDLRGLLDAIGLMHYGLPPAEALAMGITNKVFDEYEPTLIQDIISLRLPAKLERHQLFTD